MENNQLNYTPRKGVHVPKDVKEYILKKIREGGRSAIDVVDEHGVSRAAVYRWLKDGTEEGSNPQILKSSNP